MRFFEFKLPAQDSQLFQKIQDELSDLVELTKDLPEEDPVRKQVSAYLEKLKTKAGVTEDAVETAADDLLTALATAIGGPGSTMALMDIQKLKEKVKAQLSQFGQAHQQVGKEEADTEFKSWYRNIKSILLLLGKKAQGYTDLSDEDFKAMPSAQRASAKKVQINAEKFAQDLGQSLQAMFMNKVFGQDETKITKEQVLTFLQDALDGSVIDNASLVKQQGVGNLENYFDSRYKNIFDEIKTELFKLKPPASGSANVGPGELALAMLGNPAEKPDKGDIKIGKEMYEIKAGAGSVGGRFNSSEVGKANEAWSDWTAGLKEIVPNDKFTDRFNNVTMSSGKQRTKIASKYNWNDAGIKALNTEVLGPYSDFTKTQKLLTNVFRRIVKNYAELTDFDKAIELMIAQDGTIKPDYMKYYGKIVYDSYNKADGVTNIILINTNNLQFTVIRNSKDLMNRVGQDFKPTGGFNWNDNQQTASPQFVISK